MAPEDVKAGLVFQLIGERALQITPTQEWFTENEDKKAGRCWAQA